MKKRARKAKVSRKTTETDITLTLNIDGKGEGRIDTSIPFFDHMLTLLKRHGLFDLDIKAKGDIEVDFHHTVEDVAICLGEALKKALGGKKGIRRYGSSSVPMMDALCTVILDLGGRPNLVLRVEKDARAVTKKIFSAASDRGFDFSMVEEFLRAFSNSAGMDLHVTLHYGSDLHHSIEAVFKALGRALREAASTDTRIKGVMSTKGKL